MEKQIELGMRVKDEVTGFIGITVSKCIYLNGCVQFAVKPPIDEKGEIKEDVWIDEAQLEIVDHGILPKPESANRKASGGHRSHPEM